MLSGKCFQAYLPSHIQLCWNNQMLHNLYAGRGWLTTANYCSICCPQQLSVWITSAGMEGHFAGPCSGGSFIFRVFLGRQQLEQGLHILRFYHRGCCHQIWLRRWPKPPGWLWAFLDQPCPAGVPGPAHVVLHGKEKVVTNFFLLHPSAAETEPSSVVLDISFCFPPSLLLQ